MKLFLLMLCCIFSMNVAAQVATFNKRIQIGCNNTILTGIEVTDSCYYITGVAADSTTCVKGSFFARYDTMGNIDFYKVYEGIESWHPFLRTTWDNRFVIVPYNWNTPNYWWGGLTQFDNQGNWGSIDTIYNPINYGGYIRPDDVQMTLDSGYLIGSHVDGSGLDMHILKLDKNRNEEWHVLRGHPDYIESLPDIYVEEDGNFVIGYMQNNLSGVPMNYTVRSILEGLDSAGNTLWTYQSPSNQQIYGVNDFTKTKDDGWVVASAYGSEKIASSGTYSVYLHDAYLYKLDSNRNLVWDRIFDDGVEDRVDFVRVIELGDSSLVAFGSVSRWSAVANAYIKHGRIVKLSPHGDSIWSREYEYLTTAGAKHTIYDAEQTHDGGFLICGEANGVGSGIAQQGWLLKLDEYGCLVPGCHLVASTDVLLEEKVQVTLYPNPTIDYLNLYYQNVELGAELTFRILDIQGRLQAVYNTADISNKSYLLPVYELVTGIYVVELLQDGKRIYSEQFVKE